jgi:hypothetical protein
MYGNCWGEGLKNLFCLMFVYNLIISKLRVPATNVYDVVCNKSVNSELS